MEGSDDDFNDFLKRRKPVFRSPDDLFEPPAELDRVVLRQAREAIESERPVRVFRNPRWAMPLALAATLVLGFTAVFYAGLPQQHAPVPEVTVQNVAERVDTPQAEAPVAPAPASVANNQVVVDLNVPMAARRESVAGEALPANSGLVSSEEADRFAPPPPSAPLVAREPGMAAASADRSSAVIASPSANSTEIPSWRREAKTWLAEIERLRNAGDTARAEAELAEYKRQQRAYAGAPDR
jgi:hypothetical protein